jgi:hypothetical protein
VGDRPVEPLGEPVDHLVLYPIVGTTGAEPEPHRRGVCEDAGVPRLRPTSPVGIALTAYQLWRRLPPRQRRQLLELTRRHGPRAAAALLARRRRPL